MANFRSSLAFALVLALPGMAFGQSSDDAAYCQALGAKYIANQSEHAQTVTESVAIARCEADPAGSIAVLERSLKQVRLGLPARDNSTVSQRL